MSRALQIPPPGFDELGVDEKIDYVQALWDRIAADADAVPLHSWQKDVLDHRMAMHRESPDDAKPWRQAMAEIEGRLKAG